MVHISEIRMAAGKCIVRPRWARSVLGFALVLGICSTLALGDGGFLDDVKRDTAELCRPASRVLGSPGHAQAKSLIIERINRLDGIELVRQPFDVMVPQTRRATIAVLDGDFKGSHAVYPIWPDNVRLNTTPEGGLSGPVVYIRDGRYESLPARSLFGGIAVMEMSAYTDNRWMRAFEFGARAVLFLGSDRDAAQAPSYVPIYKPRYYIPDGPLADAFRQGRMGRVTIECDAEWVNATGENLLALMPGSDRTLKPIVIVGSYDAMSVVPDQAPGADNAVDAAFLLRMLEHLAQFPPKRGVVVAFIDGFGFNILGMRHLAAMLSITEEDATRQAYEPHFKDRIREYEEAVQQIQEMEDDPLAALSKLHDRQQFRVLQRYVKDHMSPEILSNREVLMKLRLEAAQSKSKEEAAEFTKRLEKELRRKAELSAILGGILTTAEVPTENLDECIEIWDAVKERCQKQLAEAQKDPTIFEKYDLVRGEVVRIMQIPASETIPFPFVLGIDLSDSGVTVGPAYYCSMLHQNYNTAAEPFIRWFRNVLGSREKPYADVPAERLTALGLAADSLQPLVDQILNVEELQMATARRTIMEAHPDLSDAATDRILNAIREEQAKGSSNIRQVALGALSMELPALGIQEAERLVGAVVNVESLRGTVDASSITVDQIALLASVSSSFQMNGVTWTALEGIRSKVDTPQDRFENLNWDRLDPQIRMTSLLVEMLLNDPEFQPTASPARRGAFPSWRFAEGVVVSETVAETIARTPQPGMMITSFTHNPNVGPAPRGTRGQEFVKSGADGRFMFAAAPENTGWPARRRSMGAYGLAPDGRIIRSVAVIRSMLSQASESLFAFRQRPPLAPLRGETFECVELNGPEFRDPRYQKPLFGGRLIDVGRGGEPKRAVFSRMPGPMFGLLPPDTRWQLILGFGGGRNRMILMDIAKDLNVKGIPLREAIQSGFSVDEPLPAIPELISARDFYLVDEWRLLRLEGAGVVCEAMRGIHAETQKLIEKAEVAYEADDGATYKRAAVAAMASEIRVYHAALDQANDVTRGAIFLLLLLVPFAVAMERLLFASPDVVKQITRSMAIFVVMFIALASFHPGFRITTMPAVILIAFLVLLLSVSVIHMILSKFRADMEELRRGTLAEASGAQTGRGGVVVSAIWLGIASMRKRMGRTLLTGLTIVLVTFALLCFTSSSTYQNRRTTDLPNAERIHDGVLLQHPASQELDIDTEEHVVNLLGDGTTIVGRYWATPGSVEPLWRIHVRNPATNVLATFKVGLGLRPQENLFSSAAKVLPNWEQFADGNGVYISSIMAERLGVEAGDTVVVAGGDLKLLGLFDGREFEQEMRKLDGQSLLPIDYTIQKEDRALGDQGIMESALAEGAMIEPDPSMIFVSGDEVVIMPVALAKRLRASLRSIAIRSDNEASADLAERLIQTIVYPVYYGAEDGVKAIVSTPLMPKAPRKLFIPILIAVLIIFNTMLNSIAERKKEIYIYSSLGLAPRHIGLLFLAEALTYGLMGSVFGYVIGQGTAKILTGLDLMGGITLNYSGSNVIMTMGLVMAVVVCSAIVPALMAAKVASPSGELDWKVPAPENDLIQGQLPFTVSRQAASGLAAFLVEFIDAHSEGAIGSFTSAKVRIEPGEGQCILKLKSTIWPAPYDLGVRQEMIIDFQAQEGDICNLMFRFEHVAGPQRSWWRLNRNFLGVIRSQLLGWRNLPPQRMLKYIRMAERGELLNAGTIEIETSELKSQTT